MSDQTPLGLQLFSVRHECAADLPGTLRQVAAIGYDGVEFAGFYDYPADELKRMLDDLGLRCCGSHSRWQTLQGDELKHTIEFNQTLDNDYLIVPGLPPERTESRQAWLETARLFNGLLEPVRAAGMRLGYHNHDSDFHVLEGEHPWDLFMSHTDDAIIGQVDTGNGLRAQTDVTPYIRKYPGRSVTVHLKDYSAAEGEDAIIGQGDVDWPGFFAACSEAGRTQWYIVEHENESRDALEAARACHDGVRELLA